MADISAPQAAAYGIWGPAYAQALAAQAQGPVAGPLNMLAMRGYMGNEQGGYSQDLAATRAAQLAAMEREALSKERVAALNVVPSGIQYGGTEYLNPLLQQFGLNPNLQAGMARDASVSGDLAAGAFKDQTAGVANMADVGLLPTPEVISEQLFPVAEGEAAIPLSPYMTPDAKNDQMRAEAAKTQAAAAVTAANRPRGGGGGGGGGQTTEIRMTPNILTGQMEPTIVIRKANQSVIDQYMPGTNVVEQSGGAESAQQRLARIRQRERRD